MDINDLANLIQGKQKNTSANPYAQMLNKVAGKTVKGASKAGKKSFDIMSVLADMILPVTEATNIAEGRGKPADYGWIAANFTPVGKVGKGIKAGAKATKAGAKAAAATTDDLLRAFARLIKP
jgi:hypothetical protein